METKTPFTQAHLENKLWANELEFYREEIGIFQKHLDELHEGSLSNEELERRSYFREYLGGYRNMILQLESEISRAEGIMAQHAIANPTQSLDDVKVGDHEPFRQRVEEFKSDYFRFREEYKAFAGQI